MRRSPSEDRISDGYDSIIRINVGDRIMAAAKIAEETLEPPLPVILVRRIIDKTLVVNLTANQSLTVATQNGNVLISEAADKFRAILFERCESCRIFVFCKLLKVLFSGCNDCMISLRGGIIGTCEFFRCVNANIDIRSELPIVQVEECSVHFIQRIDDCFYSAQACFDVTFSLVDSSGLPQKKYHCPPFTNVRHYMIVSKTDGFVVIAMPYSLLNIDRHLIFLDEDDLDPAFGDVLSKFGSTPK